MSNLHEMKIQMREIQPLQQRRLYTRDKIRYRETAQKCSQKHLDHIADLQRNRSKTRQKTQKVMMKV